MDIDSEHLGIPDTQYETIVRMPAAEFQRICRDMNMIGDSGTVLFDSVRRRTTAAACGRWVQCGDEVLTGCWRRRARRTPRSRVQ